MILSLTHDILGIYQIKVGYKNCMIEWQNKQKTNKKQNSANSMKYLLMVIYFVNSY